MACGGKGGGGGWWRVRVVFPFLSLSLSLCLLIYTKWDQDNIIVMLCYGGRRSIVVL